MKKLFTGIPIKLVLLDIVTLITFSIMNASFSLIITTLVDKRIDDTFVYCKI